MYATYARQYLLLASDACISVGSCFVVYSSQKLYHFFTFSFEFYFRDGVLHRTKIIHHYSSSFFVHCWINPTSHRSVSINFAAAFCNVVENAESAVISQSGETMPVITYKLLPVISHPFQTFNVCIRKQHFSFFTAYSAV